MQSKHTQQLTFVWQLGLLSPSQDPGNSSGVQHPTWRHKDLYSVFIYLLFQRFTCFAMSQDWMQWFLDNCQRNPWIWLGEILLDIRLFSFKAVLFISTMLIKTCSHTSCGLTAKNYRSPCCSQLYTFISRFKLPVNENEKTWGKTRFDCCCRTDRGKNSDELQKKPT